MKLNVLLRKKILVESNRPQWGNKEYLSYDKMEKGQRVNTNPVILYLGTWNRRLKSGNVYDYWCALDLNTLTPEQISALRYNLPEILEKTTIKQRYWTGKRLIPDIFVNSYRTYRVDNIGSRVKGRIYALDVQDSDLERASKFAQEDEYEDLDSVEDEALMSSYLSRAVRERGQEEEEQQEQAAMQRQIDQPKPEFQQTREIVQPEPEPEIGDEDDTRLQ